MQELNPPLFHCECVRVKTEIQSQTVDLTHRSLLRGFYADVLAFSLCKNKTKICLLHSFRIEIKGKYTVTLIIYKNYKKDILLQSLFIKIKMKTYCYTYCLLKLKGKQQRIGKIWSFSASRMCGGDYQNLTAKYKPFTGR